MTLEYKREEIERLVDKLTPPDYEVQTEDQGQRTGVGTLRAALTLISQVFCADPDSILSLQRLAAERIAKLSSDNLARLQEINQLLTVVSIKPAKLDTTSLRKIRDIFSDLAKVSDSETKLDKLQQIVTQVEKTLAQLSNSKAPLFTKGPGEAIARIHELLELYESDLDTLLELSRRFFTSVGQALNSGLFLDSSERHADEVVATLDGVLAQGDLGASDLLKSLAVTSVGLGMVDTTLQPANPLGYKYSGGYSVVDGRPAFLEGVESLPVSPQAETAVPLTVDGVDTSVSVPAATAAQISTTLSSDLFPFPHVSTLTTAGDGTSSFVKTPLTVPVKFKFAVDGVVYTGSKPTYINDLNNLAFVINQIFGATIAVASNQLLTITSPTKGSSSSLLFFDTLELEEDPFVGSEADGNAGFGLNYSVLGEARGTDVALNDLEFGNLSGSSTKLNLGTVTTPLTSTAESQVSLITSLAVQVGDKALINDGHYRVNKVTTTDDQSTVIISPVTPFYVGDVMVPADQVENVAVTFIRERVRVDSASQVFGTTGVVGTGDSLLGFPTTASTSSGEHDSVTLASAVQKGSPIRLGDVVLDSSGNRFASIQGAKGKNLKLSLDSGKTFPSGQINILPLGAYSYLQITDGTNLQLLNEGIAKVFEEADLPEVLKQYATSLSGREVLTDKLIAHLSAMSAIQAVYSLYTASMTKELTTLLSTMSESGMSKVKDMLLDLRIDEIRNLNTDSLSASGKLSKSLGILENEVSQGEDFIQLSETQSTIPLDEYDPFDDDISDNELPYLDESETEEGLIDEY